MVACRHPTHRCVAELWCGARIGAGATLGSSPYNRANGSHVFDITYTSTNVKVYVDGVKQFDQNGTFGDGRFGLYSAWQGPAETFSNFTVLPADFGFSATVDRATGVITLKNTSTVAIDFDYYELTSASSSLKTAGWNSLSDQNFQSVGGGDDPGETWNEAGGSSSASLAEVFLQASSSFSPGMSVSIGNAYNNFLNGQDLALRFRLPTGQLLDGFVNYINDAPMGIPGDYNNDSKVDAADYVLWRKNPAAFGGSPAGYNTWRANFGNHAGSGSSLGDGTSVPEPATAALACCLGLFVAIVRPRAARSLKIRTA